MKIGVLVECAECVCFFPSSSLKYCILRPSAWDTIGELGKGRIEDRHGRRRRRVEISAFSLSTKCDKLCPTPVNNGPDEKKFRYFLPKPEGTEYCQKTISLQLSL
jgi:hypothetical protein